jgi:hypothetical protein
VSAIADFDNLSSAVSLVMIHPAMIRRLIQLAPSTVVLLLVLGGLASLLTNSPASYFVRWMG